jgi:hypothetical protein
LVLGLRAVNQQLCKLASWNTFNPVLIRLRESAKTFKGRWNAIARVHLDYQHPALPNALKLDWRDNDSLQEIIHLEVDSDVDIQSITLNGLGPGRAARESYISKPIDYSNQRSILQSYNVERLWAQLCQEHLSQPPHRTSFWPGSQAECKSPKDLTGCPLWNLVHTWLCWRWEALVMITIICLVLEQGQKPIVRSSTNAATNTISNRCAATEARENFLQIRFIQSNSEFAEIMRFDPYKPRPTHYESLKKAKRTAKVQMGTVLLAPFSKWLTAC